MLFRERRERLTASAKSAAVPGFEALDGRLPASEAGRGLLRKAFPDHWSFMLGELALYSFVVLVLTGTFLTFFFDASTSKSVYEGSYAPLNGVTVTDAYRSVVELSFDVRAGLVMRQTHHWAALVFVASVVIHLCRIFFTGAFRRPRELNWLVGILLLFLALGEGFTGYSLPDDLLSGIGLRIFYAVTLAIPVIGTWVTYLLFGGEFPAGDIISRLWPEQTFKSVSLLLFVTAVLALLGGVAQINPVWQYGPFEPYDVTSPAQPDWYIGFLDGAL